jgi:lysophospholipase L1-like esterase
MPSERLRTCPLLTAEPLEAAYRQIVARAHEHGIRVIGATLPPIRGLCQRQGRGGAPAGQCLDQDVRRVRWRDRFSDPLRFDLRFNDGDHLHPNDAGYQAMADAIDLRLITGR